MFSIYTYIYVVYSQHLNGLVAVDVYLKMRICNLTMYGRTEIVTHEFACSCRSTYTGARLYRQICAHK